MSVRIIIGVTKREKSRLEVFPIKKAAVINDLSGFGKCSLTAAIPVLSALGVQCCPLATAVLTGQTGYQHYACTDLTAMLPLYTERWQQNHAEFDSIYSGYMTGIEQLMNFEDFLTHFRTDHTFFLVDPVMGDDGRVYGMYTPELLDGMKQLSRKADLITPNLTEACLLADAQMERISQYSDSESLLSFAGDLAYKLREFSGHSQDIIITGIKCRDAAAPFIYNLALTENGTHTCRSHFFNRSFSGTGDLFASVMCGCRTRGMDTVSAMELAGSFLYHSIADTMNENIDRNDGVNFEKFLLELIEGVNRL